MTARKPAQKLPNEPDLIQSAKKGDKEAYRQLVEGYQDRLFGLVLSMVSNREQAEDLSQEILVKAYFALPKFSGDSAFYTWLFRIASNHCLDFLRRRRPVEISMDAPVGEEGEASRAEQFEAPTSDAPEAPLETHAESAAILDELDPDQRLILSLRELEGYSYEELAKTMNCGVNTIKSRLNRAREALREAFRRRYGNKFDESPVQEVGERP